MLNTCRPNTLLFKGFSKTIHTESEEVTPFTICASTPGILKQGCRSDEGEHSKSGSQIERKQFL